MREAKVVELLRDHGWVAVRAASGPVDVVAMASIRAEHPSSGR